MKSWPLVHEIFNKNSYRNLFEVLPHWCFYDAAVLEHYKKSHRIKTQILHLIESFFLNALNQILISELIEQGGNPESRVWSRLEEAKNKVNFGKTQKLSIPWSLYVKEH